MTWIEVLKWVLIAVVIAVFCICFIIVFIRKVKNGEQIDPVSIAVEFGNKLIECVETTNDAFDELSKAAGIPTGALKKDSALSKIKQFCESKGITYDESLWSKEIDKYVELMNYERDKEVQSTEQVMTENNEKVDAVATLKIRRTD